MKEDQEIAEGHRIQKEARNKPHVWQRIPTGDRKPRREQKLKGKLKKSKENHRTKENNQENTKDRRPR